MKIKCVKCESIEELMPQEINMLINIAKTYDMEVSPTDYTAILSIIKGKCTDGDKHLYIYEETFSKKIIEIISEHNKLTKEHETKEIEQSETFSKIKNLETELLQLKQKTVENIKEREELDVKTVENIKEFQKETGTTDIKMWS